MVFFVLFLLTFDKVKLKMPGKRNLRRENEIRRMMTKKRRTEKVMLDYIKTLHPGVFNEASTYYLDLDRMYPNKGDLTKTAEFQALLTNKVATMNNFQLKIQLLDSGTATTITTTPTAEARPDPEPEKTPATEAMPDPEPEKTPATEAMPDPEPEKTPAAEETPTPAAETTLPKALGTTTDPASETMSFLPELDERTLEQLIAELQQDPVMADFLDNIDFELDDCPLW